MHVVWACKLFCCTNKCATLDRVLHVFSLHFYIKELYFKFDVCIYRISASNPSPLRSASCLESNITRIRTRIGSLSAPIRIHQIYDKGYENSNIQFDPFTPLIKYSYGQRDERDSAIDVVEEHLRVFLFWLCHDNPLLVMLHYVLLCGCVLSEIMEWIIR
jgi:hypothetical protein